MADFIFRISPNIVLGPYTLSRIGQYVREYGSRFLIVMDPILKEVNLADKLLDPLSERKIDYFVFNEFGESADTKTIERVLALARDGHIHGIIAAGGSKVLGVGCAIASLYNENHDLYDYVDGAVPTTGALPLICVPTTIREPFIYASAVPIVDSRSHQIKLLKAQSALCKLAVIDPNLTLTLTDNQNTAMAIETMCLAFEAYLSQKATFFSDMLVEKSVELMGYAIGGSPTLEITTPEEILKSQAGCMASLATAASAPGLGTLLSLCINSRFAVEPHRIAVNIIDKIDKIHCHRIKFSNFITDISIAQFNESCKPPAFKMSGIAGIFPNNRSISVVIGTALQRKTAVLAALYQL